MPIEAQFVSGKLPIVSQKAALWESETVAANRVAAINPPIDDTFPIRKFRIDPGIHTNLQNPAEFSPKGKPIRNFSIDPTSSIRTQLRTPFLQTPFPRLLRSTLFGHVFVHIVCGRKRNPNPNFFGPDIFRWGRGLPHEAVGAKKFGMSLETREIKLFWRDIPGFCRDIPAVPEKFEKIKFLFATPRPATGVQNVPGVSFGVSLGPFGPQRHPEGHSRDILDSCSRPGALHAFVHIVCGRWGSEKIPP